MCLRIGCNVFELKFYLNDNNDINNELIIFFNTIDASIH